MNSTSIPNDDDYNTSTNATPTPRIQIAVRRNQQAGSEDEGDDEEEFEMPMVETSPHSTGSPTVSTLSASTSSSPMHTSHPDTPSMTKPSLSAPSFWSALRNQALDFAINVECTSLCLSPSGNFIWAGFSDGTMRLFDLSGRFSMENDGLQASRQKSTLMVASKFHQGFGAVACQIHARGVHTDLLMQVDMCGDYVFGGVTRGAMELYAVSTKALEQAVSSHHHAPKNKSLVKTNILDHIHVYYHADAKLKGFGACAQLRTTKRPTYLLLTGKGIKNIHIWKFQPPIDEDPDAEPNWDLLFATPTNGNTIHLLNFYRNPSGQLLGVSQSDNQKLRLWDLSAEEKERSPQSDGTIREKRPKRPPHQDVINSQGALGIAGGYGVCGGPTMYNQFSIVSLNNPKSDYNHTELALPGVNSTPDMARGRQRRGELKQVVNVATLAQDSNHALLELDDGSIVHYKATESRQGRPDLQFVTEEMTGIPPLPADYWRRTLCLGKPRGIVVAAVSIYNPNTQQGRLVVRALQSVPPNSPISTLESPELSGVAVLTPSVPSKKFKKAKKRLELSSEGTPVRKQLKPPSNSLSEVSGTSQQGTIKKKRRKTENCGTDNGTLMGISSPGELIHKKNMSRLDTGGQAEKQRKTETLQPSLQKEKINPNSFLKNETCTTTNPSTILQHNTPLVAQVSPISTTPAALEMSATPSSAESKTNRGTISKFFKPNRVLNKLLDEEVAHQKHTNSTTKELDCLKTSNDNKPSKLEKSRILKKNEEGKLVVGQQQGPTSFSGNKKAIMRNNEKGEELGKSSSTHEDKPNPSTLKQRETSSSETMKLNILSATVVKNSEQERITESTKGKTSKKASSSEQETSASATSIVQSQKENQNNLNKAGVAKVSKLTKPSCSILPAKSCFKEEHKVQESTTSEKVKNKVSVVVLAAPTRDNSKVSTGRVELHAKSKVKKEGQPEKTLMQECSQTTNLQSEKPTGQKVKKRDLEPDNKGENIRSKKVFNKRRKIDKEVANLLVELKGARSTEYQVARSKSSTNLVRQTSQKAGTPTVSRQKATSDVFLEQYQRLQSYIATLPKRPPRLLRTTLSKESTPLGKDTGLVDECRASYEMIQKRLLLSAEVTLRSLINGSISVDEARSELKETKRSYEEILFDTVRRHKLEFGSAAAMQGYSLPPIQFPFQSAFDKIEEIYCNIEPPKRLPGRPKACAQDQ